MVENSTIVNYFVDCSVTVCDLTNISAILLGVLIGGILAVYIHNIQTSQAKLRKIIAHDDILWSILSVKRENLDFKKFIEKMEEKHPPIISKENFPDDYHSIEHYNLELKKSISNHRYNADIKIIQLSEQINYDANLIVESYNPDKKQIDSLDEKIKKFMNNELNEAYQKLDDIDHQFWKLEKYENK